jgi:hypothetical protein
MKKNDDSALRNALAEFLGIMEYKVRNGVMTMDDVRSILSAIEASGGVSATIRDLAEYYHTSEVNVRSVIKRRVFGKPKRRVYYDFLEFSEAVPKSWHTKASHPAD